ncbi:MAG TPA: hypothetical protein VFC74_01235 [Oscillospiraceae bacterium]|nr:hypothetical protein [Oscillospiraceae bacterium]
MRRYFIYGCVVQLIIIIISAIAQDSEILVKGNYLLLVVMLLPVVLAGRGALDPASHSVFVKLLTFLVPSFLLLGFYFAKFGLPQGVLTFWQTLRDAN